MRRFPGRLLIFLLALAVTLPMSASAETEAQLRARLRDLKSRAGDAGSDFSAAYWKLDETEVRLDRTEARLAVAEKRLAAAKKRLNRRANGMYRRNSMEFMEVLVGAQSFDEFVTRFNYISRIGRADAVVVQQVKQLRRQLVAERTKLSRERKQRSRDVKALRARRDRLNSKLQSLDSEYRQVKARLNAVRGAESGMVAPGPNGMVFPVAGSNYYANTWGASRSGGRRRHKGTDIMAPTGTRCVAVTGGTVTSKSGGLGGKTIWLRGDSGWSFYYAHLDGWEVRSGRVRAGQLIGYVGSTGNAAGGSPHLHFEMHPGGGGAVNPYPYLRAME